MMLDEFGHEMFPEDEDLLRQINEMVRSIWRGLHGSESYNQKGLIKDFAGFRVDVEFRIKELEMRLLRVEQLNKRWVLWVTAFCAGAIVATGIYLGLSLKDIKNFIK